MSVAPDPEPHGGTNASSAPIAVQADTGGPHTEVRKPEVSVEIIFSTARQGKFDTKKWQPALQMAGTTTPEQTTCLELLEKAPEHWTAIDSDGHSLLHWAALQGSVSFGRACIEHGVPVDCRANNKQTPLMWAVLKGHLDMVRMLLDHKADVRAKDSLGATPLILAVQHFQKDVLLLLIRRNRQGLQDSDVNGCGPVHWAGYKGDMDCLKLMDYFKADFTLLDTANMTPLHRAVCARQANAAVFLIEKGCDPHARNKEGNTALDVATKMEDQRLQEALKRATAKVASTLEGKNTGEFDDLEALTQSPAAEKKKGWWADLTKDKTVQKAFPMFWLVCVSVCMFQYLTSMRPLSWEVAPTATLVFECAVPLMLLIFATVTFGDPGKVPSRTPGSSAVEELMEYLDKEPSKVEVPPGTLPPSFQKLCLTTWVMKGPRTKYCTMTEACVEEFDHYCVWVNNAIGKGNHRIFIVLAAWEASVQFLHIYILFSVLSTQLTTSGFWNTIWGALSTYPLVFFIFLGHCLTAPWVSMLLMHQSRLVLMNLTTNEMMNMGRYGHFWKAVGGTRSFVNPFHKGSARKNCMDFWVSRQRSVISSQKEGCCGPSHGHGHGGG